MKICFYQVCKGIGGGIKHKYHWIKWVRDGPREGPPQIEKVLKVFKDGCRTADIALVAVGSELKYILATENMKAGDLIKTSRVIPRIPGIYLLSPPGLIMFLRNPNIPNFA